MKPLTTTGKQVRPLTLNEHWKVIEYFHNADDLLLTTMGVDRNKLISTDEWYRMMEGEFSKAPSLRRFSYVGWEYDGDLIGHSNINNISYGEYANIHLHIWDTSFREKGLGAWFFKRSIDFFFRAFELKKILCEPHSENPAPNRLLQKLGMQPLRKYWTTPGMLNFEQFVNRYEIIAPFGEKGS